MIIRLRPQSPVGGGGGGELPPPPPPPPPPPDIDALFDLQLEVQPRTFEPLRSVQVDWSITAQSDTSVEDYTFGLILGNEEVLAQLPPTGTTSLSPFHTTLVRVGGRPRDAAPTFYWMLGQPVWLTADESGCEIREIPGSIVDSQVVEAFSQAARGGAQLRLRRNFFGMQREVEATWEAGVIRYYFPLELLLDGFYNPDYDLRLAIQFNVTHDGDEDRLEVSISDSSDFDFDTFEDITSFGVTSKLAKGFEKIAPLLLKCPIRDAEREMAQQIIAFVQDLLDDHRLLDVRVVPLANFSYLAVVVCPIPEQPQDDEVFPT